MKTRNPGTYPITTTAVRLIYGCLAVIMVWATTLTAGDKPTVRVASLSPCITEIICLLQQDNSLVGRSSACDYPASVTKVPVVGNMGIPFMERLAAQKPDYLLTSGFKDIGEKKTLESLGIKVVVVPAKTIKDYLQAVKTVGEILNCREAAAAEIERFSRQLNEFEQLVAQDGAQKRRVFLEIWAKPLMTCGGKSFLNEMIEYAGGINIAAGEGREYFSCSEEWVITQNPEIIIAPGMGAGESAKIASRRGWESIDAVTRNQIFTGLDQNLIFRLGPRTLEGIAILRECIAGKPLEKAE